jgi:hypothetical protein
MTQVENTDGQQPATHRWTDEERKSFWHRWDELAEEINRHWQKGVSAEDAINDVRREL